MGRKCKKRRKFSLVCALALYMLNQSKLYLGRHICLSICLWFYRNNHHCGKCKFQWRCKTETTARPFLFWLQQFMDEPLNDILRMISRYSENYFKRYFECDQVQGMKLSEMWKAENRLNYWFCFYVVSLLKYGKYYYIDSFSKKLTEFDIYDFRIKADRVFAVGYFEYLAK